MQENIKKSSKKPKVLTVFISIVLTILLLLTSISAFALFDFRSILQPKNIEKVIESIPYDQVIKEVLSSSDLGLDEFYKEMESEFGVEINDESLNEILEKSTIAPALSEKIGVFTDEFLEGGAELNLSKEEVKEFLNENSAVISEELDFPFDEATAQSVVDSIFETDEIQLFSSVSLEEDMPELYDGITFFFSPKIMAILLVICAVLILLMALNSWSQAFVGVGIVSLFVGLIAGALALISSFAVSFVTEFLGEALSQSLFDQFISNNNNFAIIFNVLAIFCVIIRCILVHIKKKKPS